MCHAFLFLLITRLPCAKGGGLLFSARRRDCPTQSLHKKQSLNRLRQDHQVKTPPIRVTLLGDLAGNRTRDCAVRGRRLNLLTTRPYLFCLYTISHFLENINYFYAVFLKFFQQFKSDGFSPPLSLFALFCQAFVQLCKQGI